MSEEKIIGHVSLTFINKATFGITKEDMHNSIGSQIDSMIQELRVDKQEHGDLVSLTIKLDSVQ